VRKNTILALTNGGIGDGQRGLDPEGSRSARSARHKTKLSLRQIKKGLTLSERLNKSLVWRTGRDPDEEHFSVSNSSSSGSDISQALLAIEPEATQRTENKPPKSKRPSRLALIGSLQNSVRFIDSTSRRSSHQSKARIRSTIPNRLKQSMSWISRRDKDIDYDLNSDGNYHSDDDDEDCGSDAGSENNQSLIAVESEEDTSEEEQRKAKKKKKKAKKKRKKEKKERRDANEEMHSFQGHSKHSGETSEFHKSGGVESKEDEGFMC